MLGTYFHGGRVFYESLDLRPCDGIQGEILISYNGS